MPGAADPAPAQDVLNNFSPITRDWFTSRSPRRPRLRHRPGKPSPEARTPLVVAPTGSGKTLAAFLWSLDRLAAAAPPADPKRRCRVLYISPLKALAVDVERNLRAPLAGIRHTAAGRAWLNRTSRVGRAHRRHRRRRAAPLGRKPPDILITTPESLFLLLTSKARDALRGVDTVIVDEVHAIAGTKRGAHLALSLERLDRLDSAAARPQRIGLSATVRPVDELARSSAAPGR